jgi:hypothetical protein
MHGYVFMIDGSYVDPQSAIPFRNRRASKDAQLFFRRPIREGRRAVCRTAECDLLGEGMQKKHLVPLGGEQVDWMIFYCELV